MLGPRIDIHGPTQPYAGTDSPLRVSGSGRKVPMHYSSVPTLAQHRHQSGRCAAVAALASGRFRRRWTRLATFEHGSLPSGARAHHSACWRPDRGAAAEQETKTKVVSQKQHTTNRGGVMLFFVDARRERRQSTTNRSHRKGRRLRIAEDRGRVDRQTCAPTKRQRLGSRSVGSAFEPASGPSPYVPSLMATEINGPRFQRGRMQTSPISAQTAKNANPTAA